MTVELDRAKQVETPAETVPQQVETPVPTGLETRGALLAVCGIGGGVGTSTLAFLTAMHVQHFCAKSVLLSDTGGPGASLAVLAGQSSPLSLGKAAAAIAADALGVPLFVPVTPKLRLIAREPELDDPADTDGLARLLHDARDAHPLTIVDCGTLQRSIERSVAEQASAILWVTQASALGATRAQATLRSLSQSADQEILAVRPGESRDSEVEHQLMSAADIRGASLVFVPALPDVCNGGADAALEAGQLALEAIRVRLT